MRKSDRIIISLAKGVEYIRCMRKIRVHLTAQSMRLADWPGLDPDYYEYAVGFLQVQLELKDWRLDNYEMLDSGVRSTKANRLPYELVRYNDLPQNEQKTRLYDALRPSKGTPLDVLAIMREAAREMHIDLEAFCKRHNLNLNCNPMVEAVGGNSVTSNASHIDDMLIKICESQLRIMDRIEEIKAMLDFEAQNELSENITQAEMPSFDRKGRLKAALVQRMRQKRTANGGGALV